MVRAVEAIKDAMLELKDGGGVKTAIFYGCCVMAVLVVLGVLAAIGGFIYCQINGIQIQF